MGSNIVNFKWVLGESGFGNGFHFSRHAQQRYSLRHCWVHKQRRDWTTAVLLSGDLPDKDNTERPNVNYCRLSSPWVSLSMGSLPLQVWIEILGRVEVEALGHTIDPCCRAQMGLYFGHLKGLWVDIWSFWKFQGCLVILDVMGYLSQFRGFMNILIILKVLGVFLWF